MIDLRVLGIIVLVVTGGAILLMIGFVCFLRFWAKHEALKLTDEGELVIRRQKGRP